MNPGIELGHEPWIWSLDLLQVAPLVLATAAYALRARRLGRRGRAVARGRQLSYYAGIGLVAVALVSPIDWLGEERLLWAHMLQHVLLGDVGALAVVLGLTGPMLRPLLALRPVRALRPLAHPAVALPLWAVDLYAWHLPTLYGAALAHDSVHALQHALLFATGALVWAAVVEPLPGPTWFGTGWKMLYVIGMWAVGALLANVLVFAGHPFYGFYARDERAWGIGRLTDQRAAGGIVVLEGTLVTLGVLAWLGLRWLDETERRQRLVEAGEDAATATRAVRYGRPMG